MNKALFLDRDGVVNKMVKKRSEFYSKIIDDSPFELNEFKFNDHIKELVNFAKSKKYFPVIVTNQPSLLKENKSMRNYEKINSKICSYLGMGRSQIFECFHKEGFSLECECRKPKPGLFLMAKGLFNIDLASSIMIGDSYIDIIAAENAGLKKAIYLIRNSSQEEIGNKEDLVNITKIIKRPITINNLNEIVENNLI